jgi:hypothetical protein
LRWVRTTTVTVVLASVEKDELVADVVVEEWASYITLKQCSVALIRNKA